MKASKKSFEPLGAGPHLYETMVFRLGTDRCSVTECGCGGRLVSDWEGLAQIRAMTAGEANAIHMKLCRQFARKKD